MTLTFTFNLPLFLSDATSSSLNSKITSFCSKSSNLSLISQRSLFLNKTQIKCTRIYARNSKRGSGYREIRRFLAESVYIFATKLDILPEPLGTIIKEFGGGKGGGVRFFKGFGGGEFFRKNKTLSFLGFVMVFGCVMWMGLGKRLELSDFGLVILLLFIFRGLISKCWKRGFKEWVQGVCFIASMGFLGLKRESLQKLMKGIREMINSRRVSGRAM